MKKKTLKIFGLIFLLLLGFLVYLNFDSKSDIIYGASFSVFHSNELELDWKKTFNALTDDLGIRHFRLSAHWPLTEIRDGVFDFGPLDYQIAKLQKLNGTAVLVIGRRAPGWPECHIPEWAKNLDDETFRQRQLEYMSRVVERYKDSPVIKYWQVENEPFLGVFAKEHCGGATPTEDLIEEIAMVKKIDSNTPVLITDSGEISTWRKPYKYGDAFGTSLYVYIMNKNLGEFKYHLPAIFFDIKRFVWEWWYGKKPSFIIELAAEPWLAQPIKDTPIDVQLSRMGVDKMKEVVNLARRTGFERQYLWGAEWWYYLKERGISEHWEYAREIYTTSLKAN